MVTDVSYEAYLRWRRAARREEAQDFDRELWEGMGTSERGGRMRILQIAADKIPDGINDPNWGAW